LEIVINKLKNNVENDVNPNNSHSLLSENQSLQVMLESARSDKQKLETEIMQMQSEFLEICDKLTSLEDQDSAVRSLQNENVILSSSLKSKSSECLLLQKELQELKDIHENSSIDQDRLNQIQSSLVKKNREILEKDKQISELKTMCLE